MNQSYVKRREDFRPLALKVLLDESFHRNWEISFLFAVTSFNILFRCEEITVLVVRETKIPTLSWRLPFACEE